MDLIIGIIVFIVLAYILIILVLLLIKGILSIVESILPPSKKKNKSIVDYFPPETDDLTPQEK